MTIPTAVPSAEDQDMLIPLNELSPKKLQPKDDLLPAMPTLADIPNLVENQLVDDPPLMRFRWKIENFSGLNKREYRSDTFKAGGFKWCLLLFPKGNGVESLSIYLEVADVGSLPNEWNRFVRFSLSIVNQIDDKYSVTREVHHQFRVQESDWGFTSYMPLIELCDPARGYLVNDTLIVEAEVNVLSNVRRTVHNSRKETDYVGLKNQGATCYMNSLLQTMYHIPYFRKAVYQMPTSENDTPSTSFPLALQNLFYKLQFSDTSVATTELTESFGWNSGDSSLQRDVQEFNRLFCEHIENNMKSTAVGGTIQELFKGHLTNCIECINVEFKSVKTESFYDIQLDVKGCRDVYASFDKYVEVERLEGDNKYHAGQQGLQDATKGVLFVDFPPVLQLHLKRFEYESTQNTMVKINDRYEFPLQLDLDRDDKKYLSPGSDRTVRNLYSLHSVLVHSGGGHEGHYYAFIRPTLSDQWYKFDDETVTREDAKRALEEQYGCKQEILSASLGYESNSLNFTKYSSAYMLVYIRESDKAKIICDVGEKDIPQNLKERLKKEHAEKGYKADADLYSVVKVARDEDFKEQVGRDVYFDLVDYEKVQTFRVLRQMSFSVFKEEVAKKFDIPARFQRFWLWATRRNQTYRIHRLLSPMEEAQSVGQIREVTSKTYSAELNLFLEIEVNQDLHPINPPDKTDENIMLFFKNYDPEKGLLRYVGRLSVKSTGKPLEILSKLNEMAGYSTDQEIELYEEISFELAVMCESINKETPFRDSELADGDIICFQKAVLSACDNHPQYPDVPSFLEYMHNRQVVQFHYLEKPVEENFSLEMSKLYTYDRVVEEVAQFIGLGDPSKIRLTSHNQFIDQPKMHPIRYRGVDRLSDMLVHCNQTSAILYYEVLDVPLPELQHLKSLKVAFRDASKEKMVLHTIRLPRLSTVGDVLNDLRTKLKLSNPRAELRMLEVYFHKIYKVFPLDEKIHNINDQYLTLLAEEIPEEEKSIGPQDRLIHVYHFTRDTHLNQIKNFGEPFLLVMHEKETLAEIKGRIQKRLQVPDEDFAKWKFAVLKLSRVEYLEDSDVVSACFQRREVYGAWEQYLGLEHVDTALEKGNTTHQD